MRLGTHLVSLSALFATRGVLAQLTATATSATPDVTYPSNDAFVFCSAQDCTGTCAVIDANTVPKDDGEGAPAFLSVYWYNGGNYSWELFVCNVWECDDAVQIGENTCYNVYAGGVATPFVEYYYLVDSIP